MTALSKVSLEFGSAYVVGDFEFSDGRKVKVGGVFDDEDVTWFAEEKNQDEATEDFALSLLQSIHNAVVEKVAE